MQFMSKTKSTVLSLIVLFLSLISCRPIIAIGWTEIIIIVVLIAILLGPLLFRVYRFIDKLQKAAKNEKKK
jgi:hypothetical protein